MRKAPSALLRRWTRLLPLASSRVPTQESTRRMYCARTGQSSKSWPPGDSHALYAARKEGCTSKAMEGAAEGGYVDVVRFLLEYYPESCSGSALDAALRDGHIPVLQFVRDQYGKNDECGMSIGYTISCGHVAAVTFVCARYKANFKGDSLTSANVDTLFDLVQLFDACGIDGWTTKAMDHAAAIGCLDAVRYLHERRTEGCTTKAMDMAAANGLLDVVKFLHEHRSEGCSKDAMDGAAETGALDGMQFLQEHRDEGCTSAAIEKAALNSRLDSIRFVLDHYDPPVTSKAVSNAALAGNVEVFGLLLRLCPPDKISGLFCLIVGEGHVAMLKYFHGLVAIEQNDIIAGLIEAAKNGHWPAVKFLLSHLVDEESADFAVASALEGAARIGDIDTVQCC